MSRIKELDIVWRKVIAYSAITALALVMGAMIGLSFKARVQNTNQSGFLDQATLSELKNKTSQQWQEFQAEKQRLEEQFQALQEMSTTTATTTPTTTPTSTPAIPIPPGIH